MNLQALKEYGKEHGVSEDTIIMIFREALYLAAKKEFLGQEIFFEVENDKYFTLSHNSYKVLKTRDLGVTFLKIDFYYHFQFLLYKTYPDKFNEVTNADEKINEFKEKERSRKAFLKVWLSDDYSSDGPYCSACQQAPCMCSDREATSTIHDFNLIV